MSRHLKKLLKILKEFIDFTILEIRTKTKNNSLEITVNPLIKYFCGKKNFSPKWGKNEKHGIALHFHKSF